MTSRVVYLFAVSLLTPSAGIRKTRSNSTLEVSKVSTADCSKLTGIIIDGKDWSPQMQLVCRIWPDSMGEFPVHDVNRAKELVEKALRPGGTWEQIKEIRENHNGKPFCWRNETLRLTQSGGECEMESNGMCYGACPYGYKPGRLAGSFRPVCSSVCGATYFPVSCGFGCSTTARSCASTLLTQVATVASGVGSVYSIVTGDDRIVRVVDAVLTFSEFILGVLPDVIDAVKQGIDIIRDNESGAMVLILLLKYIQEVAPEIGETLESIREAFEQLAEVIGSLAQERLLTGAISVGSIIREILDHGDSILDYAVRITRAFSFARCSPATSNVAFTVEDVGDDGFSGPYVQEGNFNGHPKYSLQMDTARAVQWVSQQGWTFVHGGYIYDTWHYKSLSRDYDYPLTGWTPFYDNVPPPAPDVVSVRARLTGP